MNCCSNCFNDEEIKGIVVSEGIRGKCNICGSSNVWIMDIETNYKLAPYFEELLDIYTPVNDLPADYPKEELALIKDTLYSDWNIFNIKPQLIYIFLINVCKEKYNMNPNLFNELVGIKEKTDIVYLDKNSIMGSSNWKAFSEEIKHYQRFNTELINLNVLDYFLKYCTKKYSVNDILYRARICRESDNFGVQEMGAPPMQVVGAGRLNPEGIPYLYLSNNKDVAIGEIRANIHDFVSVAEFRLKKDINVINFSAFKKISPFIFDMDFRSYAVNNKHLQEITKEIEKPLRNFETKLHYLPTQYISEFIKLQGYEGIEYSSTVVEEGINLAGFDETMFECLDIVKYDVHGLQYNYRKAHV